MRKTDLAIFLPSLRGGGAERSMVGLANGLAHRGVLVDLVVAESTGPLLDELSAEVRLVDLKSRRVARTLFPLARYIRHAQPETVLSTLNHANVMAILARILSFRKARLAIREAGSPAIAASKSPTRGSIISLWALRALRKMPDVIIAPSPGSAESLASILGIPDHQIEVLPNPSFSRRDLIRANVEVDHPFFESKCPVVLAAGRLTAAKDYPTLLAAFAQVRSRMPVRLLILGDGEERRNLEDIIERLGLTCDVALPGFVANPFAFMRRASVFVLSSAWEGLPNVLIQALSVGTPVVSTNCDFGPDYILDGGRFGALVPVGDVPALAHAIQNSLARGTTPESVTEWIEQFSEESSLDAYARALSLRIASD